MCARACMCVGCSTEMRESIGRIYGLCVVKGERRCEKYAPVRHIYNGEMCPFFFSLLNCTYCVAVHSLEGAQRCK